TIAASKARSNGPESSAPPPNTYPPPPSSSTTGCCAYPRSASPRLHTASARIFFTRFFLWIHMRQRHADRLTPSTLSSVRREWPTGSGLGKEGRRLNGLAQQTNQ